MKDSIRSLYILYVSEKPYDIDNAMFTYAKKYWIAQIPGIKIKNESSR